MDKIDKSVTKCCPYVPSVRQAGWRVSRLVQGPVSGDGIWARGCVLQSLVTGRSSLMTGSVSSGFQWRWSHLECICLKQGSEILYIFEML